MNRHTPITPGDQGRSLGRIEGALLALADDITQMRAELHALRCEINHDKERFQIILENKVNKSAVAKIMGGAIAIVAAGAAVADAAFGALGVK